MGGSVGGASNSIQLYEWSYDGSNNSIHHSIIRRSNSLFPSCFASLIVGTYKTRCDAKRKLRREREVVGISTYICLMLDGDDEWAHYFNQTL